MSCVEDRICAKSIGPRGQIRRFIFRLQLHFLERRSVAVSRLPSTASNTLRDLCAPRADTLQLRLGAPRLKGTFAIGPDSRANADLLGDEFGRDDG